MTWWEQSSSCSRPRATSSPESSSRSREAELPDVLQLLQLPLVPARGGTGVRRRAPFRRAATGAGMPARRLARLLCLAAPLAPAPAPRLHLVQLGGGEAHGGPGRPRTPQELAAARSGRQRRAPRQLQIRRFLLPPDRATQRLRAAHAPLGFPARHQLLHAPPGLVPGRLLPEAERADFSLR